MTTLETIGGVGGSYTDDQLRDIGRRARHWVVSAYREWKNAQDAR